MGPREDDDYQEAEEDLWSDGIDATDDMVYERTVISLIINQCILMVVMEEERRNNS